MTITCKYSCKECGLHRVEVQVPARPKGMEIIHWLHKICGNTIAADHAMRSPACHADTMTDLMIPISGADVIGGPSIN